MILIYNNITVLRPLDKVDIVISVFNQEGIIERVLWGVFKNTTTPFNLIIIFDGCTDRTKSRALSYINKASSRLLLELIIKDTPNLFELRANNAGFMLAKSDYLITVQDDMVIKEFGWERRLTYPLRKFDDILAVSARAAQNIKMICKGTESYANTAGHDQFNSSPRNIFSIRDVVIRGPLAFRLDYLRKLDYLNDAYAPGNLDDAEISLRAWIQYHWKVGVFWVNYVSRPEWSKVNDKDSTMNVWGDNGSWNRNKIRIYEDFGGYIDSGLKHDEDVVIEKHDIDYIVSPLTSFVKRFFWIFWMPIRIDKRSARRFVLENKYKVVEVIKKPIIKLLVLFFGYSVRDSIEKDGFKKGLLLFFKKKMTGRW